jgi:hypothetical protein
MLHFLCSFFPLLAEHVCFTRPHGYFIIVPLVITPVSVTWYYISVNCKNVVCTHISLHCDELCTISFQVRSFLSNDSKCCSHYKELHRSNWAIRGSTGHSPYPTILLVKSQLQIEYTGNHLLCKATEMFWKGMFSLGNNQINLYSLYT